MKNNTKSSDGVRGRQKSKPVIHLEAESDKRIFENYWFNDLLGSVRFEAGSVNKESGTRTEGCGAVVKAVAANRSEGTRAYGIVDRDRLMADRNWDLLRETDDEAFEDAQPFDGVKVTLRWEMESYLIEPAAVETFVASAQGGRAMRPLHQVEAELLDHAHALIPFAAFHQAVHLSDRPAGSDSFAVKGSRDDVNHRIVRDRLPSLPDEVGENYKEIIPRVEAFDNPNASARQRLHGLLRIVNGKAFMLRIKSAAGVQYDVMFHLAKEVMRNPGVPNEFKEFVGRCIEES